MLTSLRDFIVAVTVFAIMLVSSALLWIATNVFESLYIQSAIDDLDALSSNLSNDLIPYVASEEDFFAVSKQLLHLDNYENVKYAAVFNSDRRLIQPYVGKAMLQLQQDAPSNINAVSTVTRYAEQPEGVHEAGGNTIAFKVIGDTAFPVGYLLIVSDLTKPLNASKKKLVIAVLPLMVLMLVGVTVVFVSLQNKALRPLQELNAFMQKIKHTKNYGLIAEVKGKREIAMLTEGFNEMMQTIDLELTKNKKQTKTLLLQQEQMEKLANFDTLTNLPNRQFFMETLRLALARVKRERSDLTVMFLDLDGFKAVNDSFGHEIGDELLRQVANKLKELVRDSDVISRLGGDEFLVLLTDSPDQNTIHNIAQRLIEKISEPFKIAQWEVKIGLSIGVANAKNANYQLATLVSNADLAMYESKNSGRSQYKQFLPSMTEGNRRKTLIANNLSLAIQNNEFTLTYQAKFSKLSEIEGYEALLRWNNDDLGIVSPAEFIPIAEQSGKVTEITLWVFERVCKDIKILSNVNPMLTVSLNLSVYDLENEMLEDSFMQLMKANQIDPKQIELEITETAYLENFSRANRFFNKMRQLGCKIALDDFGTGYSSLGYLTQISIDTLKIDKQFVDRIGVSERSAVITKTIIEMAKQLNLKVCAEGVETPSQMSFLIDNGCHLLQGYLLAKPKTLNQLLAGREKYG